ncbi:hypothetical protein NPIL_698021 [Nephila pilipes]|uniref:Uncharacterized protein n=1 Tax=Nephila pilipes TaxID=299642 RepID=A0A8X6QQF8_NEPPI|nr:hypothetical protein NPIL_698021 [Nephila pilipes]
MTTTPKDPFSDDAALSREEWSRRRVMSEIGGGTGIGSDIVISKCLGIPPSTLNSIISKRRENREHADKYETSAKKRKTSNMSTYSELESSLRLIRAGSYYKYFCGWEYSSSEGV